MNDKFKELRELVTELKVENDSHLRAFLKGEINNLVDEIEEAFKKLNVDRELLS